MIRTIIIVLEILLFTIIMIPFMVVLFIVRKADARKVGRFVQRILKAETGIILWLSGTDWEIVGSENLPENRSFLLVANHRSVFDIVALFAVIEREFAFVGKKETSSIPVVAQFLILVNGLFLDRKDIRQGMQVILKAIDYIKEGLSVCIFPEGTRTKKGKVEEMLPFHAGSFKVATKTGAPIVPVVMTGTREIFEDHVPCVRAGHITVSIGKPIEPEELEEHDKRHIGDYVRNKMIEMAVQ